MRVFVCVSVNCPRINNMVNTDIYVCHSVVDEINSKEPRAENSTLLYATRDNEIFKCGQSVLYIIYDFVIKKLKIRIITVGTNLSKQCPIIK